jgi:hypothetical protein
VELEDPPEVLDEPLSEELVELLVLLFPDDPDDSDDADDEEDELEPVLVSEALEPPRLSVR